MKTTIKKSIPRVAQKVSKKSVVNKVIKQLPRVSQKEQMRKNLEANTKAGKYSSGVGVGY